MLGQTVPKIFWMRSRGVEVRACGAHHCTAPPASWERCAGARSGQRAQCFPPLATGPPGARRALVLTLRRALAEAQRNEPEEMQKLIAGGMDPSIANGVGQTALHVACLWGTHKCVEVLIKAGAKVRGARAANRPGRARPRACLDTCAPC